MPNDYFSFKQFTVQQGNAAMKVCTDSCLFGAWVAGKLQVLQPARILDIGGGTGLLSLMLAQKSSAKIDCIEIEKNAAEQCRENFASSPWASRLTVHETAVQDFSPEKNYGLVITNPPFFENSLRSGDSSANHARHDTGLTLPELFISVRAAMQPGALAAVLLPYSRKNEASLLALTHGLFVKEEISVKQSPAHEAFRAMLLFTDQPTGMMQSTMLIRDDQNEYSPAFSALLKDYYLYL
ncbi:MAG: tRNA ((6))-methyltransferase [Ferruginibacter sp.]|nr:tRNA ((6))-methyltransferase [Ferruginibacter sp.]